MRRNVNGSCPSRVWRAAYLHCRVRALALEGPRPHLFPALRWFSHGGMIASSGGVGREQVCVCVCVRMRVASLSELCSRHVAIVLARLRLLRFPSPLRVHRAHL